MPHRRSSTRTRSTLVSLTLAISAIVAIVVACAALAVPTVEITSHADGQRIYGSRTITLTGTASNTSQVQVVQDGSVVATADVVANAWQADVTLDDNQNELRVQTPDALVGDDVALVYPWVNATTFRPMDVVIGQADMTSTASGASASQIAAVAYGTPAYVGGILYLPDPRNNRVLGFIGLPASDGAAADFVLGQASFTANAANDDEQDGLEGATPTARTMSCPSAVASDGTRLLVADACNNRILVYDALPTTTFAPAEDGRGRHGRQRLPQQPLRALRRLTEHEHRARAEFRSGARLSSHGSVRTNPRTVSAVCRCCSSRSMLATSSPACGP